MRVLGLSCLTNMGAGMRGGVLDHADVKEVAGAATRSMIDLIAAIVRSLPELPIRQDLITRFRLGYDAN
jgi:purine nucleoside phosphorylase